MATTCHPPPLAAGEFNTKDLAQELLVNGAERLVPEIAR